MLRYFAELPEQETAMAMPQRNNVEVGILSAGKFTPFPHGAVPLWLNAINSGGFQATGGYVGFAW